MLTLITRHWAPNLLHWIWSVFVALWVDKANQGGQDEEELCGEKDRGDREEHQVGV